MNRKRENIISEAPIVDERDAASGYGLSKLVGERITEVATRKAGLNGTIIRIGQISYAFP